MLAAPTTGPQYRCGAICTWRTSAIAGDFLGFENAADAAQIHLQDGRGAGVEQPAKIVLGGQPLAGRDGDAGGARHLRHFLGRIGRHRLLEPQRIVGLQAAREPDRAGRGHLPMGPEQQVGAWSRRPRAAGAEALAAIEVGEPQLPAVEGAVGSGRIEFQRREALRQVFRCAFGGEIRIHDRHRCDRPARA